MNQNVFFKFNKQRVNKPQVNKPQVNNQLIKPTNIKQFHKSQVIKAIDFYTQMKKIKYNKLFKRNNYKK